VVEQLIAAGAGLDVHGNEGYGRCADCIGRTLFNVATDLSAGALRSSWPRRRVTHAWSSSSSPPAPDSMCRTAKGTALVPSELALRCQIRQLTGLLGRRTALVLAAMKGHTPVVEQLIAAGAGLDVQNNEGYGHCADSIGRKPFIAATDFSAGTLRSSRPRVGATRSWSSSSSLPAPDSTSRTTKGRAVVPTASAARHSTQQLISRQGHCAHLGRDERPDARGRAAHRRRRYPRCPEQSRVRPLCRQPRPHAIQPGN